MVSQRHPAYVLSVPSRSELVGRSWSLFVCIDRMDCRRQGYLIFRRFFHERFPCNFPIHCPAALLGLRPRTQSLNATATTVILTGLLAGECHAQLERISYTIVDMWITRSHTATNNPAGCNSSRKGGAISNTSCGAPTSKVRRNCCCCRV